MFDWQDIEGLQARSTSILPSVMTFAAGSIATCVSGHRGVRDRYRDGSTAVEGDGWGRKKYCLMEDGLRP
jgi:hypothetical protein